MSYFFGVVSRITGSESENINVEEPWVTCFCKSTGEVKEQIMRKMWKELDDRFDICTGKLVSSVEEITIPDDAFEVQCEYNRMYDFNKKYDIDTQFEWFYKITSPDVHENTTWNYKIVCTQLSQIQLSNIF